jgi:glycosyltransferase involved in cell wall biosynthesis
MKIMHFSAGRINPSAAKVGSVNFIYYLAREQVKLGHEVEIVIIPRKTDYENIQNPEFRLREYNCSRVFGFAVPPLKLIRDLLSGRITMDVAHLHGAYDPENAVIGAILSRLKIPYIISSHGSFSPLALKGKKPLKLAFKYVFGKRLVNGARRIHLHSRAEIGDLKIYGTKIPYAVVEHGFDQNLLSSIELEDDWIGSRYPEYRESLKLAFLGRIDPWHKGLDLLCKALAEVGFDDWALFLAGPEKQRYKGILPKLVKDLNIDNKVVFLGPIYEPKSKYSFLKSADIFVCPSRFEGFPLTLFEAMACGLTPIVTPGSGAGEILKEHGVGFISPGTVDGLRRTLNIAYIAYRRGDLHHEGKKAKELVKKFTWERTARLVLELYREVIAT